MYVNPFWCGVATTIIVEVGIVIVTDLIGGTKDEED